MAPWVACDDAGESPPPPCGEFAGARSPDDRRTIAIAPHSLHVLVRPSAYGAQAPLPRSRTPRGACSTTHRGQQEAVPALRRAAHYGVGAILLTAAGSVKPQPMRRVARTPTRSLVKYADVSVTTWVALRSATMTRLRGIAQTIFS
jgi:hypothetical protein